MTKTITLTVFVPAQPDSFYRSLVWLCDRGFTLDKFHRGGIALPDGRAQAWVKI